MQIPERPGSGNDAPDGGAPSYEWLDEWLCEYVDGTMDPSLEAVFDQYVEANPELKAHVKRLRQTRELLCGCDRVDEPTAGTRAEMRSEVEEDMLLSSVPLSTLVRKRPFTMAGLASSVAMALVVGFLAGSMLGGPTLLSPPPTATTNASSEPATEQSASHADAPTPAVRLETPSFSTENRMLPRRTAGPTSGPDTIGGTSTFMAVDAR